MSAHADRRIGELTLRATRALAHRGPDGEGFWAAADGIGRLCAEHELAAPASLVFGHRRLSIVDLDGGAQPMANEDGTVWVSFNGEIYNQADLRAELEAHGHRFATRADTEVLVHGWEEWRERLFGKLNGIFAFALADTRTGEVVLVRDPVGVKPLYVGVSGELTWWASELQAASAAGLVSRQISPDALKLFLTFRFVPSPRSIFEDSWKIPPGHFVRLERRAAGREPEFLPYACEIRSSAEPRHRGEWREALMDELEAAVERQLMADVPVATLLSGGIDSSLVTQMMAAHLPYAPHAFGIGFEADGAANETLAGERAARALGAPFHPSVVADDEYVDAWPAALEELGEPIANSGALLVRQICEEVGRTHKVVLSGQGADEPLGGYPRHLVERLHRYGRVAPTLGSAVARRAFGGDNGARLARALEARGRVDRYVQIFAVVPAPDVDAAVPHGSAPARELARDAVSRWISADEPADTLNELLRVDTRMSLADDLLVIADHFSMRSSVELRVPFLDLAFLELAERMPSRYKISPLGTRKWLYRDGATRRLPSELARALSPPGRLTRKRGFSTPRNWFEGEAHVLTQGDSWTRSLARLPIATEAIASLTETAGPRQRALLYTLGLWTDRHRELALAA